jgi:hypothetical protein
MPIRKKADTEEKDPVLAALLKQRAEQLAKLDAKISDRKRKQKSQSRKVRNRVLMLTGIAHHAEAELHPEKRKDITALLDRGITSEKDRAFLKAEGWL